MSVWASSAGALASRRISAKLALLSWRLSAGRSDFVISSHLFITAERSSFSICCSINLGQSGGSVSLSYTAVKRVQSSIRMRQSWLSRGGRARPF